MKRSDFEARLRELRRVPRGSARAKMFVSDLERAAPDMAHALREELRRVAAEHGLGGGTIVAKPLGVGESWLLLFEPPEHGHVFRLRAFFEAGGKEGRLEAEIRRAYRGLVASAAKVGRHLDHRVPPVVTMDSPTLAHFEIEGSSLGLSVAIAALSAATLRAPDSRVAASAQVLNDGRLAPVEHLGPKLEALRQAHPEVERVLVAAGQDTRDYLGPLEIVTVHQLADAVSPCGLTFDSLPEARLDSFRERIERFAGENGRPHGVDDWKRLSLEAWETAKVLEPHEPARAGSALAFAARFAVHSGDPEGATTLLREAPTLDVEAYPELHACRLIARATSSIDLDDPSHARALAAEAVAACEALGGSDRRELLGQAYGTLGRAILHAGSPAEAEGPLRRGLDHHAKVCPSEAPRSACYLATCLRRMRRLEDAAQIVDAAIEALKPERWDLHVTTKNYLHLERARILLEANDSAAAIAAFELVCRAQSRDSSYPRLGALRGLATAFRVAGELARADEALRACLAVGRAAGTPPTIARVAAIPAGELLVSDARTSVDRADLEQVWRVAFGPDLSRDGIRERLSTWIY